MRDSKKSKTEPKQQYCSNIQKKYIFYFLGTKSFRIYCDSESNIFGNDTSAATLETPEHCELVNGKFGIGWTLEAANRTKNDDQEG